MNTIATELLLIGLAVASISVAICCTRASERPRFWIYPRCNWLGELLSCPYCLSHYLALGCVLWRWPVPGLVGLLLATFAVVTLANIFAFVLWTFIRALDRE